jgi:hypothetical protein
VLVLNIILVLKMSTKLLLTHSTTVINEIDVNPKDWSKILKICIDNEIMTTEEIILELEKLGISAIEKEDEEEDDVKKTKNKYRFPKGKARNFPREIKSNKTGVKFMSVQDINKVYWFWSKPLSLPYYREKIRILIEKLKEHLINGQMDNNTRKTLKEFYNDWKNN